MDENSNFVSISSDGRVTLWTLLKTELSSFDIIKLRLLGKSPAGGIRTDNLGESFNVSSTTEGSTTEETIGIASGTCFDFCKVNPDIFVVGTEDGRFYMMNR